MRLSKQQAAARLEVSTATIERKIQRGELKAEKEPHGSRYRVWVIFDDDETPEAAVATPVQAPVETLVASVLRRDETPVETGIATPLPPELAPAVEMARLQERNKALEELAGYHRQLLSDSEWRVPRDGPPAQAEQRHDRDPEQGPSPNRKMNRMTPPHRPQQRRLRKSDVAPAGGHSAGNSGAGAQAGRQVCREQVENRQINRLMKVQKGRP